MKLMYLNGAMTGQEVELIPSGTTIGRETDNAIQLMMDGVSRYHARIERDPSGKWLVRDLGSTNGTLVDDVPVQGAAPLNAGSVITIGTQLLRCMDGAAATRSVPPPPSQPQMATQAQPFFFRPQATTQTSIPTSAPAPAAAPRQQAPAPATPPEGGTFFGRKQSRKEPSDRSKKFLSNVIFALIVFIAACLGIALFLWLNGDHNQGGGGQAPVKRKVSNPFVLYYEKESVSGTAVFRFTLQVENGQMEVTLDEPLNKRRYYELFQEPLPDALIAKLVQQFQDSGFMELQQEKIAGTSQDNRQHRRIMVGFENKFCDVKVSNDVSETFNRAESIIYETLLEEYDLGVISQNVDQILEDARRFLFVAEEAYRNIDTTPSNLPKAIANYELALRRYKLFDDPKPPEFKTARDGLARAEAKLEEIRVEGNKTVKLYYELREYEKAIAECNRLLEIFPPDSKTHQAIRESKLRIEQKLSMRNK